MRLIETVIEGVTIIEPEPFSDERGLFARIFDREIFAEAGLDSEVAQVNLSYNRHAGTIRGMHRQVPPHAEGKLVRCVAGAVVDVALDVREGSATFGEHVLVELSAQNRRALFIPPYVAHGFQALTDDCELIYQVSGPYVPHAEQGFRFDDPAFAIPWPQSATVVSQKDRDWPLHSSAGA